MWRKGGAGEKRPRRRGGALALLALVLPGCAVQFRRIEADRLFTQACAAHVDERRDAAEVGYRASLALAPSAAAANNLGVLAAERGNPEAARSWFEQAVALDETDIIALTNLGVVLFHLGRTGAAMDHFVAAQEARRDAAERILPVGRVNWDLDRYLAATARAEATAARYLDRLMSTTAVPEPPLPDGTALARVLILTPVRL